MKANEIMADDLLRVTKDVCIKKGTIVRVRAIDADDTIPEKGLKGAIRCQPIDDEYGMNIGGVWADFLEPIPLSAEILEKNGFTKSTIFIEWKYEEEGIYILWKPFPFLKVETENVQLNLSRCEYVHELQHALRLCGIDKEIVL